MPRYKVVTERALYNGIIIEAADEEAAKNYDGTIIDESETDTWCNSTISVEQVDDECEMVEDLP